MKINPIRTPYDEELKELIYQHFSRRKTYYDLPRWKRILLCLLPCIYAEVLGVRLAYKVDLKRKVYLIGVEKIK